MAWWRATCSLSLKRSPYRAWNALQRRRAPPNHTQGRRDVRLGPPQAEGHDAIRLAKLHIIDLASRRIDMAQPLLRPVSMAYIRAMLWRTSRGRPNNAPAAFIPPCRSTVAHLPPRGPGWAHELKHDGCVVAGLPDRDANEAAQMALRGLIHQAAA